MKFMSDIIPFPGSTTLNIDPRQVLEGALKANLKEAIVIGTDENGYFYLASSEGRAPDINWLLDQAKEYLLEYNNVVD